MGSPGLSRLFLNKSCFKMSHRFLTGLAITYKEHGDPETVLQLTECEVKKDLSPTGVLVKMLAAPINPADINMIQGKYALKPSLPAVGGNEGVGVVQKIGSSVSRLKIGDHVIPSQAGWGTWKTLAVCDEDSFIKVDSSLPLVTAATISVNPCTAYRMIKDFVDLKEGDTIIQNGANSGVGQAAIQIAKWLNLNTINVIRDRPEVDELKKYLYSLGATCVVTEADLRKKDMEDIFQKIPKASLALNCVGGKSAAELTRHMKFQGTMVTYGGMSKQPLTISTASLIFQDICYQGYWMTRWTQSNSREKRMDMLEEITSIIKNGHLKPPLCEQVHFENFKQAVTKSLESYVSKKQVLVMD